MIFKILLGLAFVLVFAFGMFMFAGPEKIWRRLGAIEPLELSQWAGRSSPNWALACPMLEDGTRYCKGIAPTHESPVATAKPIDIYNWLISRIEADGFPSRNSGSARTASAINIVARDDEAIKIRFEALSPGLRFPDIIDLEVFAIGKKQAGFALLSQSVLGQEDFDLNARRIERVLEDFADIYERN